MFLSSILLKRTLSSLSAVAAIGSPSRLGTATPLSSTPLLAAPDLDAHEARATKVGRLRRSLRAATAEGIVAEVVAACTGGAILTAWGLYLHASPLLLGAILSLSQLAQLLQFPAAWTTAWLGHRRACIVLVALSRQALLPLALLPFLPISEGARQVVLLCVSALAAGLGVLGNNAWVSWMSDLVPRRVRGRFFGRRTALCTLGGALAAALVGLLMDYGKAHELTGHALALLQLLGCVGGIVCTLLMLRQHDPGGEHTQVRFQLSQLSKPLRDPQVRGLLVYLIVWNSAVGVAGSFFAMHELQNLKLSFTLLALHGTAVALVKTCAAPFWGSLLDRVGARPVLIACSFGICAIPFVWLFATPTFLWPLLLDVLLAGVLWSGHGLAAFNLPLAITPRAERPFYLAAFATVSGLCFSVATLAGGALSSVLPDRVVIAGFSLCDLQVLFVLSGLLRVIGAVVALRISEPASHDVRVIWSSLLRAFPRAANDQSSAGKARANAA